MTQQTTTLKPKATSTWERLEDFARAQAQHFIQALMEQLAAPGSILVTVYTHRLTDGYFEFKALGQTQIKGVEDPLNVYKVVGADRCVRACKSRLPDAG